MERVSEADAGIAASGGAWPRPTAPCAPSNGDDREESPAAARARRGGALRRAHEPIRQHNHWYPIERDLPLDMRTRDHVKLNGRSYRAAELGPAWVLEQFPAR